MIGRLKEAVGRIFSPPLVPTVLEAEAMKLSLTELLRLGAEVDNPHNTIVIQKEIQRRLFGTPEPSSQMCYDKGADIELLSHLGVSWAVTCPDIAIRRVAEEEVRRRLGAIPMWDLIQRTGLALPLPTIAVPDKSRYQNSHIDHSSHRF